MRKEEVKEKIAEGETFHMKVENRKKRKLKKGETDYPRYDFKTFEEMFDALTAENMNRFFRDFKTGVSASVHMREVVAAVAKEQGLGAVPKTDLLKMPSFTWIDD